MAVSIVVAMVFALGREPAQAAERAVAPNGFCLIVDPLLDLGCGSGPASGPAGASAASSSSSDAGEDAVGVRATSTVARYDPRRLAVTFARGASLRAIHTAIERAQGTIVQAIPQINAYLVGIDPSHRAASLASLNSSPVVASASREPLAEAFDTVPNDIDWPLQNGLRVAGFPKAWDITRGSSRVVVAVVDTGVDPRAADLRGAIVPGYDFVNSTPVVSDDHGHGTAVAGVIAARANNHEGAAGICWRCSIMPIKVLDAKGYGDDTLIAAGVVWATDHGAQVINLSLGGVATSQDLTNAIGYAAARGVVLVAAAGNSGSSQLFYPAGDPRTVSVAATTVSDNRYSWSNYGPWVDVAAPGCNIAPALSSGYAVFCGTSSATPIVSGLVALGLSADPTATAGQIEQAVETTARPLPGVAHYGRVDAGRTLAALDPESSNTLSAVFTDSFDGWTRSRSYPLTISGGRLTATLEFSGQTPLVLSLASRGNKRLIARTEGTSPLQLQATLPAGSVVLRVSGRSAGRSSYTLTVSYPHRQTP